MKCSSCTAEFSPQQIEEKKQGLISPTVKCPSCGVWLKKDGKSSTLQVAGVVLFIPGMLGAQGYIPVNQILGFAVMVVGFTAILYSFKLSKWQPLNENS